MKYTIASADNSNRWVGFMFRYESLDNYMQMCCRQNAAASGGINSSYYNGSWQYAENCSGQYQAIDPQQIYTAKMVVKGNEVALYVNDTLCVITTAQRDASGRFGIQTSGCVVRVYGVSVAEAEKETAYSREFSDLKAAHTLPEGFEAVRGTPTAGDGYLELSSGAVLLLPENVTYKDFTYEVRFTIASAENNSRWVGFMFRYESLDNYMQMCCRQNAAASGGINSSYYNGSWQYAENCSGQYQAIDPQQVYTAKMVVKGNEVALYINDTLCVITTAQRDASGRFGIQTSGAVARIYSVSISEAEEVPAKFPGVEEVKQVYEANTGIVAAPTVIQAIDSSDLLDTLDVTGPRPQVARFQIADQQLNVQVGKDTYPLAKILEFCGKAVLPLFVTADQETAEAFSRYIQRTGTLDVILASDNVDALKAAWTINPTGVRYAYIAGAVTSSNTVVDIARSTHTACATIAILAPGKTVDRATAEYLQQRAISVWLDTSQAEDVQAVYDAVDCGANGVTVKNFAAAYSLYERVTQTTNIRKTFIIGHRGMPSVAPDNSREGYLEAVSAGADMLEFDLSITGDGVLIGNHDGAVDGFTTSDITGPTTDYTWEQLSQYTLKPVGKYTTSQFCKLEWLLEILQDNPSVVGFVELKDNNEIVIQKAVELMEQMGVENQVMFISFDQQGLMCVKKYAPYMGTALIAFVRYDQETGVAGNLLSMMQAVGPTASSPDYAFHAFTGELIEQSRHRGMITQSWVSNFVAELQSQHRIGVDCIATDYADYAGDSVLNAYKAVTAAALFAEQPDTKGNLAAGKPVIDVSSSFEEAGNSKNNLTDGSRKTNYASDISKNTSPDSVEWFTVDLEEETAFNQVVMTPFYHSFNNSYTADCFPIGYEIQVSHDGKSFETVAVVEYQMEEAAPQTITFDQVTARYVRVYATKLDQHNDLGTYLIQLSEFELYLDEEAEPGKPTAPTGPTSPSDPSNPSNPSDPAGTDSTSGSTAPADTEPVGGADTGVTRSALPLLLALGGVTTAVIALSRRKKSV